MKDNAPDKLHHWPFAVWSITFKIHFQFLACSQIDKQKFIQIYPSYLVIYAIVEEALYAIDSVSTMVVDDP
jgi:hypothetical protein